MGNQVGIVSAACHLPAQKRKTSDLFQEEGISLTPEIARRLGIEEVPVDSGEGGSAMALAASQEALRKAGLTADQLDFIVDYTILPQEYLVPAWNMSNKLQHELGAKKAFTVGFSGGGATNFLVSLASAAAMLEANPNFKAGLLVAADVTIPGNRVLNPKDPVSVMGDGASAVVLQKDAAGSVVVGTELWSDAANHDVYYIPGGALVHADDPGKYRMELDKSRYEGASRHETLMRLSGALLKRVGIDFKDVAFALYPNISHEDEVQFLQASGLRPDQLMTANRATHGHLQGNDFVLNYLSMMDGGARQEGDYVLAASHGMGFLAGVSLLRV
jgi:3-oxoacyl-[acyl-carrier-protein] synthase III